MKKPTQPFKIGDVVKEIQPLGGLNRPTVKVLAMKLISDQFDPPLWNLLAVGPPSGHQQWYYSEAFIKVIDYNNIWNSL